MYIGENFNAVNSIGGFTEFQPVTYDRTLCINAEEMPIVKKLADGNEELKIYDEAGGYTVTTLKIKFSST